ncbi:MAG: CxxxxCH/CxxCH domain-containing protein [Kofleriaceae bacterium]|nr:CxxxxCH/CxxCH domain-containing protein [Myxococcales bacterium]MCB9565538.1 CxxxxCH/CxxCH domain-containing protein [Kofleriaceae bacterium]MCB9572351.1 CxxxxCH/CxxCH domain-containing protein [Kofleriaceae bacterium]
MLAVVVVGCLTFLAACTDGFGGRYHPDNYAMGAVHGPAMKSQAEDCRTCHGADLTGDSTDVGDAPSCDGCHDATGTNPTAWRTNCTFCHGGVDDDTGAPPRNVDGTDLVGPFPSHPTHVNGSDLAVAYDCVQCHVKAIDVLSPGHVFDDTPGEAENDFGAGLSPQGAFSSSDGSCSNLYCHGNGRSDNGTVTAMAPTMECSSCHASMTSGPSGWGGMSGAHALHLGALGVTCADCHTRVTSDGTQITAVALHVDGAREVDFSVGSFTWDAARQECTGACHSVQHNGFTWGGGGGGSVHPPGFAASNVHGPEFELQRQDCRGCHGDQLQGGSGPSCDSCHQQGWRTDCTYCHGGGLNDTGAPPRDLGSSNNNASQSFVAHTKHVTQGVAAAWDCVQCHVKPTDVMSLNHAFDTTPGVAENTFTAGLSPQTTYNGTGTCSNNYCHGNGRAANGTYTDGLGPVGCGSCHAGQNSGSTAWSTMSGDHRKHLNLGYKCGECHQTVSNAAGTAIIAPLLHVDGQKQVKFVATTITYNPATKRCTGPCHGEGHNETW